MTEKGGREWLLLILSLPAVVVASVLDAFFFRCFDIECVLLLFIASFDEMRILLGTFMDGTSDLRQAKYFRSTYCTQAAWGFTLRAVLWPLVPCSVFLGVLTVSLDFNWVRPKDWGMDPFPERGPVAETQLKMGRGMGRAWELGRARHGMALVGLGICRNPGLECGRLLSPHYL